MMLQPAGPVFWLRRRADVALPLEGVGFRIITDDGGANIDAGKACYCDVYAPVVRQRRSFEHSVIAAGSRRGHSPPFGPGCRFGSQMQAYKKTIGSGRLPAAAA